MNLVITSARRALWLALLGAAGGAVWTWRRGRTTTPMPPTPAEWPPLTIVDDLPGVTPDGGAASVQVAASGHESKTPSDAAKSAPPHSSATAASVVNALVDAPDARSTADSGTWVLPHDDGSCPDSHPIKANDNSGIFHLPGGRFYDRTQAERCYATADAATADGYRQAKA